MVNESEGDLILSPPDDHEDGEYPEQSGVDNGLLSESVLPRPVEATPPKEYHFVLEGGSGNYDQAVVDERRKDLEKLTEQASNSEWDEFLQELSDGTFFNNGEERQSRGEVKKLIPDAYFAGGEHDKTAVVKEVVGELRSGRSLRVIADGADPERLAALKALGVRLVQEYGPEYSRQDWSELSEGERQARRLGEIMVQTAELEWLGRAMEKSRGRESRLDGDTQGLTIENARRFRKQYLRYAENPDIPEAHASWLRDVASNLQDFVEERAQSDSESVEHRAEVGVETRTPVGSSGELASLPERARDAEARAAEPGSEAAGMEPATGEAVTHRPGPLSQSPEAAIAAIRERGFDAGTQQYLNRVLEARAVELEGQGARGKQLARDLRNYAEVLAYDLQEGDSIGGRADVRAQVVGRMRSPRYVDTTRRRLGATVTRRFGEMWQELRDSVKSGAALIGLAGGRRARRARREAIRALRDEAGRLEDGPQQQFLTQLVEEYRKIDQRDRRGGALRRTLRSWILSRITRYTEEVRRGNRVSEALSAPDTGGDGETPAADWEVVEAELVEDDSAVAGERAADDTPSREELERKLSELRSRRDDLALIVEAGNRTNRTESPFWKSRIEWLREVVREKKPDIDPAALDEEVNVGISRQVERVRDQQADVEELIRKLERQLHEDSSRRAA